MALVETPSTSRGKFCNDIGGIKKLCAHFDSDGIFRIQSCIMISTATFKCKLYYAVNKC